MFAALQGQDTVLAWEYWSRRYGCVADSVVESVIEWEEPGHASKLRIAMQPLVCPILAAAAWHLVEDQRAQRQELLSALQEPLLGMREEAKQFRVRFPVQCNDGSFVSLTIYEDLWVEHWGDEDKVVRGLYRAKERRDAQFG